MDFSWSKSDYTYTIHTATGWGYFCDLQEIGETFSGKTVKLDANIGTPEDPVTRMGSSTTQFQGTFDGQGHTLTVQYGTASEPVDQQFVAPFRHLHRLRQQRHRHLHRQRQRLRGMEPKR